MMRTQKLRQNGDTGGNAARWVGLLLPPSAWAVQLQSLYLTSEYGCADGDFKWNHVVSIAALTVSIAGGLIAGTYMPAAAGTAPKDKATPVTRKRFMSILAMVMAAFFSVVIVAQWLPTLTGVPCPK